MSILKSFTKNNKSINVYGTFEQPLFSAKEIGDILGFKCIRSTLRDMKPTWKVVRAMHTLGGDQKMTFLTEPGLYKLIMKSNKKEAVVFQSWICEDVIPTIRKTGEYKMNHTYSKNLTFNIQNEDDLHSRVVQFIKRRFPDSLFTTTLGELQDTGEKRLKAWRMGYLTGSPDIIIMNLHNKYSGFCIEFKSPTGKGVISDKQVNMIKKYKQNGYKTLVSNDYDDIIEQLLEYFKGIRIKCEYCKCLFKSDASLLKHQKYFHKISN